MSSSLFKNNAAYKLFIYKSHTHAHTHTHTHIYIYIYIYIYGISQSTNTIRKGMNPIILPRAMGK